VDPPVHLVHPARLVIHRKSSIFILYLYDYYILTILQSLVRLDKLWPEPYDPCSFKNCLIFGGHDEPYVQPFDPKACARMRRNDIDRSLGYPIGVVSGTIIVKAGIPNQESVRFGANLKGFAHSYYTRRDTCSPKGVEMESLLIG